MKRFVTKLIVPITLLVATPALAQEAGDVESFRATYLASIDIVPTRAQLESYPGDVRVLLEAAATDDSISLYERRRAISLSGHYPDDRTRAFFDRLTSDENPDIRKTAYYSLARAFGRTADAKLVTAVGAGMKDDSEDVREWAVRGLRWIAHRDALSTLQQVIEGDDESLSKIARRALRKHIGVNSESTPQ